MFSNVLTLAGLLLAHSATASFDLYAYGQTDDVTIAGQRVFYADGVAYAGDRTPANMEASTVANVTFSASDSSADTYSLTIESANATQTNTTMDGYVLAIDTTAGAFESVKFVSGNESGLTTTGFRVYGRNIMYENDDGVLQSNFYLVPTDDDTAIYELRWNVDTVDSSTNETSIPVALRDITI